MDETKLVDKFRGCLLGVAIGDALGMPVEMMTPEEILAATDDQGVRGYLAPVQTKLRGTRDLLAGGVTDDTVLTRAVALSLIRRNGYDQEDQARKFVAEFDRSTLGWGKATKNGAADFKAWFESDGRNGRNPNQPTAPPSKPNEGTGNGVAMKIAPLALFDGFRHGPNSPEFRDSAFRLGAMTHGDPRASIAAMAVGNAIALLLRCGNFPAPDFSAADLGNQLLNRVMDMERPFREFMAGKLTLSENIRLALWSLTTAESLRQNVGTSCFCVESVPFAIGVFLRHPSDFRAAVLEAVNAGGDTDSTASMVGAMVGVNVGLSGIPDDLANGCLVGAEMLRLADELYAAATMSP